MEGPLNNNGSRFGNVDPGLLIKCVVCNVQCFHGRFSNTQLDKYKEAFARQQRGGSVAQLPRCINCTPKSVAELYCTGCRLYKVLDTFSKRQRQNPDHAKCISCVQETEDRVPHLPAAVEEERIRDEQRHRNAGGSSVVSATGSVTASRSQSQVQSGSAHGVYLADESGSTWGGDSVRSPSPTNTEVSVTHTSSTYAGAGTKNSFAKQGAYRTPIQARVQTQLEREDRRKQEAQMASKRDDSNSDDSEFEL